jgi:hypothetical protein
MGWSKQQHYGFIRSLMRIYPFRKELAEKVGIGFEIQVDIFKSAPNAPNCTKISHQ